MGGRAWSTQDTETVRKHYGFLPVSMIAMATGRSESAVRNRGATIGKLTGNWNAWTTKDLAYLRRAYATRGAMFVAVQLRRSVDSVRAKACELGISRNWRQVGINRNGHRLWTPAEDARVLSAGRAHADVLAQELNRTPHAIRVRISKLQRRKALGVAA
jgi:hypothetical protein